MNSRGGTQYERIMTESLQTTNAICRTCMSVEAVDYSLFNIKKKLNDELFTMSDMIAILTSLEVNESFFSQQNFGKILCKMCVNQYICLFLSSLL